MSDLPTVPVSLRVHLAQATLQAIAEECGADVLHIKGPAVDPSLRPVNRSSVDADVLVRPAHLRRFLDALARSGWRQVTRLASGGVVEHSTNWYHGELGQADVHVRFPGIQIEPERAFDRLWEARGSIEIAHRPCTVPGLEAQGLVLLLHAARRGRDADIAVVWTNATAARRDRISALAGELGAEVAFAAATGRLEEFRDRPEYGLWRLYADGATVTRGFGFIAAAAGSAPAGYRHTRVVALRYALQAVVRMPQRFAGEHGRRPTPAELGRAYFRILQRAANDIRALRRRRAGP